MKIRLREVCYLGHILSENGIKPDPEKTKAILNMPKPENIKQLQSYLGMVNYLTKFFPKLTSMTKPLRILLKKDIIWHWDKNLE